MKKITSEIKEQIKDLLHGGFDNHEIKIKIFGTQSHTHYPECDGLIQLLRRQHDRQLKCTHPRDKRQYIGMGNLKCHVCGLVFQ